jgi:4-hydroxybenzoate polyprenyltransferase
MRPANLLTAAADILAGYAAAGLPNTTALAWLAPSGMALYAAGVVFNDFFDRRLDAIERPERPIPSGRASSAGAALLGLALLIAGVSMAFAASVLSGALAVLIAAAAVFYDAAGKHHGLIGPLNMGLCRGLNLLLGISAAPAMVSERWFLAMIPIAYIAAITTISKGEVHGGDRRSLSLAFMLIAVVFAGMLFLAASPFVRLAWQLPFLALLAYRVLPPHWRAWQKPEAGRIRAAVRAGVLSITVLDAALAAGYAGLLYGAAVLALLPFAGILARRFAVT